jgi:hypothetical protein
MIVRPSPALARKAPESNAVLFLRVKILPHCGQSIGAELFTPKKQMLGVELRGIAANRRKDSPCSVCDRKNTASFAVWRQQRDPKWFVWDQALFEIRRSVGTICAKINQRYDQSLSIIASEWNICLFTFAHLPGMPPGCRSRLMQTGAIDPGQK